MNKELMFSSKKEDRKMFEQCAINLLKIGTERKRGNCIYQAFADMRNEMEEEK